MPGGWSSCRRLELPYDYLIVAAGASHAYFGHDEWEPFAPGLKTIEDAIEIRRRVLLAFELAERQAAVGEDPDLNFVVVGGGPTGVELAGTLAEISRQVLATNFAPSTQTHPHHPARRRPARFARVPGGSFPQCGRTVAPPGRGSADFGHGDAG